MTVEVKCEAVPVVEEPVKAAADEAEKAVGEEVKCEKEETKPKMVGKSSSYREESNFLSDLKEHEKKALNELKTKLEEAIRGNTLFKKEEKTESPKKTCNQKKDEKKPTQGCEKQAEKPQECGEEKKTDAAEKPLECEAEKRTDAAEKPQECEAEKKTDAAEKPEGCEAEKKTAAAEKPEGCAKPEESEEKSEAANVVEVDEDISIWGVPLLPSKGNESTNVVLLKFLRAREFKVNDAFEMLKKTLQWRKEFNIDSIMDEEFGPELASAAYMSGVDRQGHPICYNIFGVLDNEEIFEKTLATEEKREQFLRWRVQLMEKDVQKLDFKPEGINSLVQINDLKNTPGPTKKEVRAAVNKAVALLQDNYPEFVAKNIFINVPFWYFAFHSLVNPFLSQRSRSKIVFARPSKVTETLLKYISIQEIPIQYGGIKRENDFEFSAGDGEATEVVIKPGTTETIEIPTPEAGTTFIWDLIVLGWDVHYTEEFVPTDECSYTMIIQKGKKMGSDEVPVRKTFKNHEAGKIVLTVQNCSGKKKKLFYRYKVKKACF